MKWLGSARGGSLPAVFLSLSLIVAVLIGLCAGDTFARYAEQKQAEAEAGVAAIVFDLVCTDTDLHVTEGQACSVEFELRNFAGEKVSETAFSCHVDISFQNAECRALRVDKIEEDGTRSAVYAPYAEIFPLSSVSFDSDSLTIRSPGTQQTLRLLLTAELGNTTESAGKIEDCIHISITATQVQAL